MSEPYNEKMSAPEVTTGTSTPPHDEEKQAPEVSHQPLGKPWMYKRFGFGRAKMSYASPQFQVIFVAMVCFLCPGMYNAVSGLGAAGFVTAHDIDNASTALNSTFAAVGFFCGSIANRIGLRLTLGIGGFGYFIYTASLLSYKHNQNAGFLIFAGALLGCCAAMLWTAQGAVMMAYPPEHKKGRYISWFWMIFNTGGVLGALIPLGQNVNNSSGSGVNDGTYIAFMVLMFAGFVLAAFLCNPKFVVREDGSRVILMKHPSWKSEILGLFETFRTDWYILFLFPMFLSSNWFYTYHFQDVNLPNFNTRTRTLNNVLYWSMQIVGAYVTGYMLDTKFSRKTKAKVDIIYLFLLTMAIWGGGYAYQRTYNRESTDPKTGFVGKDWTDSGYIGPLFLYMFYGFFDAAWQTSVYWLMGSLTNNSRKLANFAGFYKGIQSAGAAIASRIDALGVPYMNEFGANWGLLLGSLLIAAPVILMKVQNHTDLEEDLKFSDETIEDVAPVSANVGAEGYQAEKIHL